MPSPRTERLTLGLLAAALTWPTLGTAGFCLDDAFIHLSYLESIRSGGGVSYNPGDWETGISSPLWLLLLFLWPFGDPTVHGIKLFGAMLHAASAMLAASLARHCDPQAGPRFVWATGLLVATMPLALQGATSGMEVPLATALCLAMSIAALQARYGVAALLALLGYLARPELLVYAAALAVLLSALRRSPRPLILLGGAVAGMLTFWIYCYQVSGYIWPNTYYVKGGGVHLSSLRYLMVEVLPLQPVVLSMSGAVLAGVGAYVGYRMRHGELLAVSAAAASSLLAIALSRTLYPGVLFYQSRYFVIVLWVLPLLCAYGFSKAPRGVAYAMMLPVAGLSVYLGLSNLALHKAQEQGVMRLHVEPAAHIATRVKGAKVIGVEGAGALRYLTPRSMRIIDLMGLNHRAIAHTAAGKGSFFLKLCHLEREGVTHLAYPAQWRADLHKAFEVEDLAHFTQESYAQVDPPVAWQLTVARVTAVHDDFAEFCKSKGI